ncbi:hypothetical protein IPAKJDPM_00181 [Aeromonas phage avDM14-QBC]|nr:hypothetical protein IPAKJDPM_00181 [Aeromonas phage avDM14-QBC]UYD58739.1 hypothetical protein HNNIDBEH_00146 [Aeromonas phage avDM10-HWA]UYD58957.1 hypothetical protein OFOPOMKI_00107 [Aeromonas phage avDM7-IJDJ]
MICMSKVTLINPDGIRNVYWYNPAKMVYTSMKGEVLDAYDADQMGYVRCRTEEAKESIDAFLKRTDVEKMQNHYRDMLHNAQAPKDEEKCGSTEMDYETLTKATETADQLKLNQIKTSDLANLNARYLSTVSGMSAAAAVLEQISGGIQIGAERRWKRSSETGGGDTYVAHYSILPVADFKNVGDAIKFVKLLRSEHPLLSHIGYTKLSYTKLALNDRETDVKIVKEWNTPFTEEVLINISLGKGYRMSISCPNQRLLLNELSNYSDIPEISRIELFIDYCRRTAPKRD